MVKIIVSHRFEAALVHELNGWPKEVSQGAQLFIHRSSIPQLLLLSDCRNTNINNNHTACIPSVCPMSHVCGHLVFKMVLFKMVIFSYIKA